MPVVRGPGGTGLATALKARAPKPDVNPRTNPKAAGPPAPKRTPAPKPTQSVNPSVNPKAAGPPAPRIKVRAHTRAAPAPKPASVPLPPSLNPASDRRFPPAPKVVPVNTARAEAAHTPPKVRTSYKPFYKGQKPDHYENNPPTGLGGMDAPRGSAGVGTQPIGPHVPVYTLGKPGKAGQQGLVGVGGRVMTAEQWQAQLGTRPTVAMALLNATTHPLTDLSRQATGEAPFKLKGAASDVANIASNFVPVGKAAGLFGALRGVKALKDAKVGVEAVDAARAAKVAARVVEKAAVPAEAEVKAQARVARLEGLHGRAKAAVTGSGKVTLPSEGRISAPGHAFDRYVKVLVNPKDPTDIHYQLGVQGHELLPRFHERQWYPGDAVIQDGEIAHINYGKQIPPPETQRIALAQIRKETSLPNGATARADAIGAELTRSRAALKTIQDAPNVAAVTPSAAKVVDTAERTGAAAKLAEKHGIDLADVKGTGRGGKIVARDVAAHHLQSLDSVAQLREGLKGSRTQYGKEKAARKVEEAARGKAAAEALASISDPHAALAASGAALRGKYATIDYMGLKELNPETVKQLMTVAQNHPALGFHDKRTVMQALNRAVTEGRVPRPAELRKIEMVFGKETAAGLVKQAKQNLGDKIINVLNIPRALQTTLDISGLMRQNLVGGVSHPIFWGKSVPHMVKGATEAGFEAESQLIRDNPLYHMAVQDGVQFTDTGTHATMALHEEGFQSDIAANALDYVPKVPNVIKGSARMYAATGNYMRMSLYENRIRIAMAANDPTIHNPAVRKQIADVINAATGRGTLPGRLDHLLPAMNTFMYSPRLMLSRLHYMDPTWYFRLKGSARREAIRGLFALTGSVIGALYLFSRIPGVEVDWQHPQSSDWGKMKIGDTRIDIAGGFLQYVRLATELAPAALGGDRTYSANTGQYTKLGSGYGKPTRLTVGMNFLGNKLSPVPGAVVNAARGTDATGAKVTWESMASNYLTPLGFQDAHDAFKNRQGGLKGIEWAAGAYGLSALGLGVQTYKQKPSKASKKPQSYFGGSGSSGGSPYFASPKSGGGGGYFATP
jgi:hypothetical protein